MTTTAAVDRFLDALRGYFTDGIDVDFNTTAAGIYNPDPYAWETVKVGVTDDGDPITETVMTVKDRSQADSRAELRRFIETHSRSVLARDWSALDADSDFAALPQAVRDEFVAAVGRVLDVFASQNPGVGMPWTVAPGNNVFGTQIEAARAVVYRAAHDNPARAEITAAEQVLAAAQADLDAATTALHAAIETSDLDRISALRSVVSVELPAEVDRARQAVLDAEADAAVVDCAPFLDRQVRVEKAADTVARAVDKARAALAVAEGCKVAADNLLPATSEATAAAQQRAQHAAAARDVHAADMEAARLHRVRSFAGVS